MANNQEHMKENKNVIFIGAAPKEFSTERISLEFKKKLDNSNAIMKNLVDRLSKSTI